MLYLLHRCRKISTIFHKKLRQTEFKNKCLNEQIEQLNRDVEDYYYNHKLEKECSSNIESWLSNEMYNIALALMKFNVPLNLVRQIIYTNAVKFEKYGISIQRIVPDYSRLTIDVYR
ncbi:MAG: hypothetical protein MJZ34_07500 [Paludibacteraceae bacterium]|nr:hypothetical protein [Paludibacteraceae bacterium]